MCPPTYYESMLNCKDLRQLRFKMVQAALEYGNKPTAKAFHTTVKTVRKWRKRYQEKGYLALQNQSKAPKHPANQIPEAQRLRAIALKKRLPSFGAARIKREFKLTISVKAILRIWRAEGLLRTKRRKHRTKNDLRQIKAQMRLFEQLCVDVKYLTDLPEYYHNWHLRGFPKYQYTAREVISGALFLGFADECCIQYASLFVERLIKHLQNCSVDLSQSRIQTDNGSEFIGSWQAKQESLFTKTVNQVEGLQHCTIPPGAHTYQSDVETVHRLIEDEFFVVETFKSIDDFFAKASAYQLWFNVARHNSYKGHKTPWQIIIERNLDADPNLLLATPLFLNKLWLQKNENPTLRGYDVRKHP